MNKKTKNTDDRKFSKRVWLNSDLFESVNLNILRSKLNDETFYTKKECDDIINSYYGIPISESQERGDI